MPQPPFPAPAAPPRAADLFDRQAADWQHDPKRAFDAWLAQQGFRRSSADVYRAQWGHFVDWLEAQRATLLEVDAQQVGAFLAGLDAKKPQRARYLRLIERVYDHLQRLRAAAPNPARRAALEPPAGWPQARGNAPTGFLTRAERDALIAHLQTPLAAAATAATADNAGRRERWREVRDRALAAVFLGAGLKLGEALVLAVDRLYLDNGWILIEAADPFFSRRTRVAAFARPLLAAWLDERADSGVPGRLAFPASLHGLPMHKATALRAIDALVDAAGIAAQRAERASPQTLRNSFAATLFEDGATPDLVAEWLGFAQPVSARRLRDAWQAWRGANPAQADTAAAGAG